MTLFPELDQERLFQTGARLSDGKTTLWHVPAHNHESAAAQLFNEIKTELKPLVVLVCIPGGKGA